MELDSKIYVAGAKGLVGSGILRKLAAAGYTNVISTGREDLDLFDQKAVKGFFEKHRPDYVIVAAARVGGIKANTTYQADFLYENLMIQLNVIWQAHLSGVKKLLFLGSSCIYPRAAAQPIREEYFLTGPLEPTNEGYAVAKIAGMKLAEKIYTQYGKKFISCMPTNIYGENDHFDPDRGHVISALMRRMHEAKMAGASEVVVWGTGNPRREFLYVDDFAEAAIFLINHYEEKEFVNVGVGEDIAIRDLAVLIKDTVGFAGGLVFDASKPDGMPRKLLDVSKINKLGWKAQIPLQEGLRKTYEWYLKYRADAPNGK